MFHAFLIAAIFVVYFGSMAAFMLHLARQVRHRDEDDDSRLDDPPAAPREDEAGPVLMAA